MVAGLLLTGVARAEPPAPLAAAHAPASLERYRAIARSEAARNGLPYEIADAIMRVESAYNPEAHGASGEVGLMQIMPPTARLLGFTGSLDDLANPETNVALGVRYLAGAFRKAGGDLCTTAMKYRAGHNETRFSLRSIDYCERVRAHLAGLNFPLVGGVPAPTFGFRDKGPRWGFGLGSVGAMRRLARGIRLKSRVGWGAYDARMRALDARAKSVTGL